MLKNNGGIDIKSPLFDGAYKHNTVLLSGMVISPVVFAATSVSHSLALICAFSVITFLTVMISSFFPRNIVYTIRIILYTLISSLVYVPVLTVVTQIFPQEVKEIGIIIPLLITNSLIVSKTELRFFRRTKGKMIIDVLSYIIGFDIVVLLVGFIREVFGTGMFSGKIIGVPMAFPALVYPFGGFILVGLLGALLKKTIITFTKC
ncbi:MAG: Rnf-Nqr domain containing protein [Oscillospiraceae bacterium]